MSPEKLNFTANHPLTQTMKTATLVLRSALAICFAFFMSSASCDLFDKVDDVTFDVSLDQVFHVNETKTDKNVVYSDLEILDAATINSDFAKYKDKIKSITITSVTYEVQNVQTTSVIFTGGSVGYSSATAVTPSQIASLGIESPAAAQNQVKNLPFSQSALDEFANFLKNDKKAAVYLVGSFDQTPAQFDVTITVKATITADALK
jgi:hypothetical protein